MCLYFPLTPPTTTAIRKEERAKSPFVRLAYLGRYTGLLPSPFPFSFGRFCVNFCGVLSVQFLMPTHSISNRSSPSGYSVFHLKATLFSYLLRCWTLALGFRRRRIAFRPDDGVSAISDVRASSCVTSYLPAKKPSPEIPSRSKTRSD